MIHLEEIDKAYADYSKEIFSYILRSVHDHDAAEDILQDVFVKLLRYSMKSSVNSSNIRALLYTIARSVCIDSVRKISKVRFESAEISMIPDSHISKEDDPSGGMIDAMNSLIDTLGEPEKSIILFKRNGLTYQEIAGIMKISERTLKRRVKSVIGLMRKKFKEDGFFVFDDTESGNESFN